MANAGSVQKRDTFYHFNQKNTKKKNNAKRKINKKRREKETMKTILKSIE